MKSICTVLIAGAMACAISAPAMAAQPAELLLHSFGSDVDGVQPHSSLVEVNGILYGTTTEGGTHSSGSVFTLNPALKKKNETVLYSFCSKAKCADGKLPDASLVAVNGLLYGTTHRGGKYGKGTVFSIDPTTGAEKVLHTFGNGADGAYPVAGLLNTSGTTLYGTTQLGGTGSGTVFEIDAGTGAETVLYSFCGQQNCTDGKYPVASLIAVNGLLYGTTKLGGKGLGTAFSLDPSSGVETVLYSFCSQSKCADGAYPVADLVDVNGTLYGTTYGGGAKKSYGTVFSLNLSSGTEQVLYSFCAQQNCTDGEYPVAGLLNVNGTLFGTTSYGGLYNGGEVFTLDPGTGTMATVYSFCTNLFCTDGGFPEADLLDVSGTLYGTTLGGGLNGYDMGAVFAITNP